MKSIFATLLLLLPAAAAAIPSEITAEYQVLTAGMTVGRVKETFARKGDTYAIRSVMTPEGALKLLMDDQWEVSSAGRVVAAGLQPLTFGQHRARDTKHDVDATFDWDKRVMSSNFGGKRTEVPVPPQTQDRISILYQFMNIERPQEVMEFSMTNGRTVEQYTYKFVADARLETPAGAFETRHYQRVTSDPKERRAEIWLAKDRNNFPVRIIYDDPRGMRLEQKLVNLQSN